MTQSHLPPKCKLHKQAITANRHLNQKKILYLYIYIQISLLRSQNGHKIDQLFPLPKMFIRCAPFPGSNVVNTPSLDNEPRKGGHALLTFLWINMIFLS